MRRTTIVLIGASLTMGHCGAPAFAHGFGGARGGGFRGGGMGGFGGGYGGMHYGGAGGFRGGYGGMPAVGHAPTFSAPGTFRGGGGEFRGYNPYSGARTASGFRDGSYTTQRGGTINYGAAGRGVVGPGGGAAGRAVGGVQATTAGGRTFTDVGRAAGAVGPGGGAVGRRSNVGVASGPRGTAVSASRAGFAGRPGVGAAGYRGWGATGYRPYGFNAYNAYHAGWVHGYWNGHNYPAWGWRGGYWGGWGWGLGGLGLGMGLGYGLASWGYGSSLYGMGYMPYYNPYYGYGGNTVVVNQPIVYDYSQPIDTTAAPVGEEVADPAMSTFDGARQSFQQGNYEQALAQADQALKTLPGDTALHEFRALCQFALARYNDAAATLYAVLSVGPGWDWATMVGLYPDPGIYTAQLRSLEAYCNANPTSAPARFVLAYHYLVQGHTEAAVAMLKQVVALMPNDALSAKLVRQLEPPSAQATATDANAQAETTAPPADATPPAGASIAGDWKAAPTADTTVTLSIQPDGRFNWQVDQKGKAQQFGGTSTFGEGILTLIQEKGPVLVGRVSWQDASHMTFRVVGDGPEDPGLSFSR